MRMPKLPFMLAVTLAFAIVAAPSANALFGMPDALTERGKTVGALYDMIATLGVIMFLIVFVWLVILIVRFREGTGHGKATHEAERHSLKAELAWTLIPLAMVLYIGYAAYGGLVTLDHGISPSQAEREIKVVGSQWNWMFDYGNGVTLFSNPDPHNGNVSAENTFYVPAGKNLLFNITSVDVIHAFQVLDANRAYVMFNDANPLGANKFALQTVNLPAGDYLVQCNKMCLNPGHAYMHAAIKAVPQPIFDRWLAEKQAGAGAGITLTLHLEAKNGMLVGADNEPLPTQDIAAQTRVIVDLKTPTQDVTLLATGAAPKTIRAGETTDTFYSFTAGTAGSYNLSASTGGFVLFHAVEAIQKSIDLVDFGLKPNTLMLEAGKQYLIHVNNKGAATHDVQLGTFDPAAPKIIAGSAAVGGAGSGIFLVTAPAAGTYDMWCNQAGHHSLGMFGTVTVQ